MSEIWKDIPGYEGLYQVSDQGRVKSLDRVVSHKIYGSQPVKGRIVKPNLRTDGYLAVSLYKRGERKLKAVHTLVALAFVGERPDGFDICHFDGTRTNNQAENLRYGSRSENIFDSVGHKTHSNASKAECPRGHLLQSPNLVRSGKGRECLACSRASSTVRYHHDLAPFFQEVSDIHYENATSESPKRVLVSDIRGTVFR